MSYSIISKISSCSPVKRDVIPVEEDHPGKRSNSQTSKNYLIVINLLYFNRIIIIRMAFALSVQPIVIDDDHRDAPEAFNNSVKPSTHKDIQKGTQEKVNDNENEHDFLIQSIIEYFSNGRIDKAQLTLNKAEELYIPENIKAWRYKIQEAKLKIKKDNDERRRHNMETLGSEEKQTLDYIEKAKEAIVNRNLVTTDKYLRDALHLITVRKESLSRNTENEQIDRNKGINKQHKTCKLNHENLSRNLEKNTEEEDINTEKYNDKGRKVSNDLERAMQTEAFKFIKKAEQEFFNSNFDEAEKLLLISQHLSPDEYVEEMLSLIQNAKNDSVSKESLTKLKQMYFKQFNTEQDYKFNHLDFAKTFKIINDYDKALEVLKTIESLYTEKTAKEFFKQIQITTENQKLSNYNICDNETTIKESNKDEARKCLSKAKEAFQEGKIEVAERLLNKSERMYSTAEAKALLNDVKINRNERIAKDKEPEKPEDVVKPKQPEKIIEYVPTSIRTLRYFMNIYKKK